MATATTETILKSVRKSGIISENEMNLLKLRKNKGEKFDESIFWDGDITITPDQFRKGISYLRNLWKTPTGKERAGNPFGYREQLALEQAKSIRLVGFHDAGNWLNSFYVPLYEVQGTTADFQYYVSGGKVNIIG